MRKFSAILFVALLLVRKDATAQSDSAAVVAPVSRMIHAMYTRDTAALRTVFDSAARLTLPRPTANGDVRVLVLSPEQFATAITNPNQPPTDEPLRGLKVFIDGATAMVWAEYQVRRGTVVSHCGYDAFTLVRRGGTWLILSVADSFKPAAECGAMWTDAPIDPRRR